ncbi:MAG: hypothetical protein ACJ71Q_08980 [Terriglobales bacterium]
MNSSDLDHLNPDLTQFFDFINHNHTYQFQLLKGQFSLREIRSAAAYILASSNRVVCTMMFALEVFLL